MSHVLVIASIIVFQLHSKNSFALRGRSNDVMQAIKGVYESTGRKNVNKTKS
jgi:hypothetical protein